MRTALNDTCGRNESNTRVLLEVGNVDNTAVAHSGLDLVEALRYVIVERTCVNDVGVNAFLEAEPCLQL